MTRGSRGRGALRFWTSAPGGRPGARGSPPGLARGFIPDGRRARLEEVEPDSTKVFNGGWLGADPTRDPVLAAYFLFYDCDLASLQWGLATVRAFVPQLPYRQAVDLAADIPSTYIVCGRDRTIRADWARRKSQ
jgi:hypothetical protein